MHMGQKGFAAMLAAKRPTRCCTRDESEEPLHAGYKACKQWIHPGFDIQGRLDQKSKKGGISSPTKRTSKIKEKQTKISIHQFNWHFLIFCSSPTKRTSKIKEKQTKISIHQFNWHFLIFWNV